MPPQYSPSPLPQRMHAELHAPGLHRPTTPIIVALAPRSKQQRLAIILARRPLHVPFLHQAQITRLRIRHIDLPMIHHGRLGGTEEASEAIPLAQSVSRIVGVRDQTDGRFGAVVLLPFGFAEVGRRPERVLLVAVQEAFGALGVFVGVRIRVGGGEAFEGVEDFASE